MVTATPAMARAAEDVAKPAVLRLDRQPTLAGKAIRPDLRLRITADRVQTESARLDGYNLHRRPTSAMIDYYPDASGQGFHLSAGTRYFTRANDARDAQRRTNGVLYAPDFRLNGLRAGYRRYAPAATMGYTSALGEHIVAGVEGGAMMGSAFNSGPRAVGSSPNRSGVNPMAHLMLGMKF